MGAAQPVSAQPAQPAQPVPQQIMVPVSESEVSHSSFDYRLLLLFLLIVILVSAMGYIMVKLNRLESLTSPILKAT